MLQAIDSMTPRWYQVGLVSLGPEKCGGTIPGIYVKLLDYLEWIEATVDEVAQATALLRDTGSSEDTFNNSDSL